jgi:ketosteroid isomerase-like protein
MNANAGQSALDRGLISDALAKYSWGYDEGDFELLGDAFTEDAVAGGKVANTDMGWGPMKGRAEIVRVLSEIRKTQTDQRRHTVSTILFDALTDTTATVRCLLVLLATEKNVGRLVSGGWYRAKFIKQGDTWRMKEQEALLDSPF